MMSEIWNMAFGQSNGIAGGSACFCSGKCRGLGYCPNQQAQGSLYDYLRQQSNAQRALIREMTAEDIGVAKPSYAFWLGAEG